MSATGGCCGGGGASVLTVQSHFSSDIDEIFAFSSKTFGKELWTIPSFTNTDFERNISSPVPAHTAATVVVWCAGESATTIFIVATPSTSILVLLAAPSVKLDGERCLSLHFIFFQILSLIIQCDAPVSASAFTVMACCLSSSAMVTSTLTLGTDFSSSLLDVCRIYPLYGEFVIALVEPVCCCWGAGAAGVVGGAVRFTRQVDSWWLSLPQDLHVWPL